MKNIKKVFSLIMAAALVLGINVPVHAEWKETSQGWAYLENGQQKTRWLQEGSNWYYLGYDGIMKTGWMNDEGTWYYLTYKGILNNAKTTKIMPDEVKGIYDVIRFYNPTGKLYYNGLVPMPKEFEKLYSNDGYSACGIYKFTELDNYGITIKEYYYSPYDGCTYVKEQTETTRLGIGDKTKNSKTISEEQAIQNVKDYINNNFKNMPLHFEIIKNTDNVYVVHFYNDESTKNSNHASITNGWYYVDKIHGNVISMYDL